MKLKNCPFCGNNAYLLNRVESVGDGEYHRYMDFMYVQCATCGAQTKDHVKKSLVEVSKYACQDFRNNPELRVYAEKQHNDYLEKLEAEVAEAWNKRN